MALMTRYHRFSHNGTDYVAKILISPGYDYRDTNCIDCLYDVLDITRNRVCDDVYTSLSEEDCEAIFSDFIHSLTDDDIEDLLVESQEILDR